MFKFFLWPTLIQCSELELYDNAIHLPTEGGAHVELNASIIQNLLGDMAVLQSSVTSLNAQLAKEEHEKARCNSVSPHLIPGTEVYDWESFQVANNTFLVSASLDSMSVNGGSVLYHFNDTTIELEAMQYIPSMGNYAVKHFEVAGDHFLIEAANWDSKSGLYRFNATSQFEAVQDISLMSPIGWEHFVASGQHYLVVVDMLGTSLFHFNSSGLLDLVKFDNTIVTASTYGLKHFEVAGEHFLLYATLTADNALVHFNETTSLLEYYSSIPSILDSEDWEHFEVAGDHFLVVANFKDDSGGTTAVNSVLYRFNETKHLDPIQDIPTVGAVDWEHFVVDGEHFLALASLIDEYESSYEVHSALFRFNEVTSKLMKVQDVPTAGARGWEHFEVAGDHFLVVANSQDDMSTTVDSVLYPFGCPKMSYL